MSGGWVGVTIGPMSSENTIIQGDCIEVLGKELAERGGEGFVDLVFADRVGDDLKSGDHSVQNDELAGREAQLVLDRNPLSLNLTVFPFESITVTCLYLSLSAGEIPEYVNLLFLTFKNEPCFSATFFTDLPRCPLLIKIVEDELVGIPFL